MKSIIVILCLISIISCEKNNTKNLKIVTGIMGNVKYGAGDCMPIIDESKRVYNNYNDDFIL